MRQPQFSQTPPPPPICANGHFFTPLKRRSALERSRTKPPAFPTDPTHTSCQKRLKTPTAEAGGRRVPRHARGPATPAEARPAACATAHAWASAPADFPRYLAGGGGRREPLLRGFCAAPPPVARRYLRGAGAFPSPKLLRCRRSTNPPPPPRQPRRGFPTA